jgi:hypothetical protein
VAWNAPMTAIAGGVVASADFNTFVRDNLNLTEAALAQTPSGFMVGTGLNAIAERVFSTDVVDVLESTSSATYVNLATVGPQVTVTTGTRAIVAFGARIGDNSNTAGTPSTTMSVAVSGATTITADATWAAGIIQPTALGRQVAIYTSRWWMFTLTPGSNTFVCKYATTSDSPTFDHRSLHVLPL